MAVIEYIQFLKNVGKFESVNSGAQLPFSKLTLLYAENARGKTTLAAVLRSLGDGDPTPILERRRLSASDPPHVVIKTGATSPLIFQNGAWTSTLPNLAIFDDAFVAQNVCSGIDVQTEHKQNLHELILGAQGVALNATVQAHVTKIEEHNRNLRARSDAIPAASRGALSVDAFCELKPHPNIEDAIKQAQRNLSAAKSADAVRKAALFDAIGLPPFHLDAIDVVLKRDLPALAGKAAERVQAHFARLGEGSEAWIGEGMSRIGPQTDDTGICPFCAQDLRNSPLIDHYRAYFSQEYSNLKRDIEDQIALIRSTHGGDVPAAFERSIRVADQCRQFWKEFTTLPDVSIDSAEIARAWKTAREAVLAELRKKQAAPLDPAVLSPSALKAVASYRALRNSVAKISDSLLATNPAIQIIKEKAAGADVATLTSDLATLKAIETRHSSRIAPLCQAYLGEKKAKADTERLRDQARAALDNYRDAIFPAYERDINAYLEKFVAGFRLGSVSSVNTRGGSACTYSVVINNTPVTLTANAGQPSFRNTLSAGDRNTLALAFCFASLDRDPQLAQKIVVIDDPITSLDEHRSLTTVQEMRHLVNKVSQLIVLSHSKPFLCAIWEGADQLARSAIKITRDHDGSTLLAWDVNQDCITEHDRRHALVADYVRTHSATDERAVAAALRPILESFVRVAYPEQFPPGSLLGPFLGMCRQRLWGPDEVLNTANVDELRDILDYANKFHHDTNLAYETEVINDQQLQHFCRRVLNFTRR